MELREVQKRAWDNKVTKGFNIHDVPLEFGLLTAEVGEAFTAWRKRLPDFGEELADIAIYLMAIAEMNGIDLDTEVANKIAKNAPVPTSATLTACSREPPSKSQRKVRRPPCPAGPTQGGSRRRPSQRRPPSARLGRVQRDGLTAAPGRVGKR